MRQANVRASGLERSSIGEITELVGAADFYNAGLSSWLKTATYTAAANLTSAMKTAFQANSSSQSCIALNSDAGTDSAIQAYANSAIARIASSSISVAQALGTNGNSGSSTTVQVAAITASGIQLVATGQTSLFSGCNNSVVSDGTSIWVDTFTAANAFSRYKTTDGVTYATQSLSGLPTFAVGATGRYALGGNSFSTSNYKKDLQGENNFVSASNPLFLTAYCGARHLVIGNDGTNYVASRSTAGLAFGGDESVAVLGSATYACTGGIYFYRNGNNCYLHLHANARRYSSDGGVTWAGATNPPTASMSATTRYKRNASTAAKLLFTDSSTTAAFQSSDSGATWTSRTLPAAPGTGGVAYIGSVILMVAGGVLYRSPDDGATWAAVTLPAATSGAPAGVAGDSNRFYLYVGSNPQLLTSTDGSTWTIRTLSANCPAFTGIASYSSNSVLLVAGTADTCLFTNDGGVTWIVAAPDTVTRASLSVGDCFTTPDGGNFALLGTGSAGTNAANAAIVLTDLTASGSFYRTGATAVTPLRANSSTYMRVA